MKARSELEIELADLRSDLPALMNVVDPLGQKRVYDCLGGEIPHNSATEDCEHIEQRLSEIWIDFRDKA